MSKLKTVLRVRGIVLVALGAVFLPVPNYVFDRGETSAFHNLADIGVFTKLGLAAIAVGLVVFGLSFLMPGRR
jgi:hypothetical protein